jgi:ketosteroid isomerase-like protein
MSTQEVADKLVAYCREGKNVDAIAELYGDDVVSKEGNFPTVTGKEGVIAKNQQWYASVDEVHSVKISDPVVTGNFFSVAMEMDVTYKKSGRLSMNEIAVYRVKDGKIISDEFFYEM